MSEKRAHALAGYADLLVASRRIDWRFLLPDPELGHVGCSTDADPALQRSCRLFSRSLSVIEGTAAELDPASLDVLVLIDPEAEALSRALALLRPDGWVYVEIHGVLTRRGRRLRRLRFPSDYVAELRRLGLDEVQAYWHWPDFDSCTQILPLSDRAVIRSALVRRQESRGRSPQVWLARLLLAVRLLSFAVTHASLIGHRPAHENRQG